MTALPTPLVRALSPSYFDEKSKIMAKLPKPRFNLKAPNSKSETLIFLVFRYRGKKVLYSTSLCVLPSEWNFKTQRPVQKERRPDLWALTRQLDDLNAYCKAIYIESEYGRISVKDFKHQLDLKAGRVEEEKPQAKIHLLRIPRPGTGRDAGTRNAKGLFGSLQTSCRHSSPFCERERHFHIRGCGLELSDLS
jgi:hypothetical protein